MECAEMSANDPQSSSDPGASVAAKLSHHFVNRHPDPEVLRKRDSSLAQAQGWHVRSDLGEGGRKVRPQDHGGARSRSRWTTAARLVVHLDRDAHLRPGAAASAPELQLEPHPPLPCSSESSLGQASPVYSHLHISRTPAGCRSETARALASNPTIPTHISSQKSRRDGRFFQ